jgi:hypothetical protein
MNLLPCPFCGESKELTECISFVECEGCLARSFKSKWNNRYFPWISVKDRLPDMYVEVLSIDKEKNTVVSWVKYNNGWESNDDFYEITHWMPLPLLPEEE